MKREISIRGRREGKSCEDLRRKIAKTHTGRKMPDRGRRGLLAALIE